LFWSLFGSGFQGNPAIASLGAQAFRLMPFTFFKDEVLGARQLVAAFEKPIKMKAAASSAPYTHFDIADKGCIHVGYCAAPTALHCYGHPIPT
jgi:hypothetical protein